MIDLDNYKVANITDDRLTNGEKSWWVDLGDQDGISEQQQCPTLDEAKEMCRQHLLPEGGLIMHFSHGDLETTYKVEGIEYNDAE